MKRLSTLKELLWVIASFGAVAIIVRLIGGLGVSTGLSDSMPWGLWKILNMVAGVALATGGFVLAATVYVFKLEKYKPVLKPAIVVAFLGYGSSCFALFLDIGLPHAIWKPLFFWNHHSFLFEVAWCVMLYFSITMFEVAPMPLERLGFKRLAGFIHKIAIPFVMFGIVLSSLHHTSLGSLFLVMPGRLHDLWFTSWIPVLFILSAIGAGMQTLILVCLGYSHFYKRDFDKGILTGLAKGSAVVLSIYLTLKFADLAARGQLGLLFSGQWETGFFFAELLLGSIAPIAMISIPRVRNSTAGLAIASTLAIVGLILNRLNVGIIGLIRTSEAGYVPKLAEVSLSLGIVAMAGLVFLFMIENLSVFGNAPTAAPAGELEDDVPGWGLGMISASTRVTFLLIIFIPIAAGLFVPGALGGITLRLQPVQRPLAVDAARTILNLDGNRNGDGALFPHADHQKRLGEDQSCKVCHHIDLPGDKSSACHLCHSDMHSPSSIFDHQLHADNLGDKWSCEKCHDSRYPKSRENCVSCLECHAEELSEESLRIDQSAFSARSYTDAMHGLCVECHQDSKYADEKPGLADCATCHASAARETDSAQPRIEED